jgi:hypothetical protein
MTAVMATLYAVAPVRTPVVRLDRAVNLSRSINLEACYGQATGQIQAVPCTHCASGSGPWTECVVVAGSFWGSCANCHYSSMGSRCSLRKLFFPLFTDRFYAVLIVK